MDDHPNCYIKFHFQKSKLFFHAWMKERQIEASKSTAKKFKPFNECIQLIHRLIKEMIGRYIDGYKEQSKIYTDNLNEWNRKTNQQLKNVQYIHFNTSELKNNTLYRNDNPILKLISCTQWPQVLTASEFTKQSVAT